MPDEPNVIWRFADLARAIRSCTDVAGFDGLTTSTIGTCATNVNGRKSLIESYGSFAINDAFAACALIDGMPKV